MATYTTQHSDDPNNVLNQVLSHLSSFGVTLLAAQKNTDNFTIMLAQPLDADQVEHLGLTEVA